MAKKSSPAIRLVEARLASQLVKTQYDLGTNPRALFPLAFSVQAPTPTDVEWTYRNKQVTARVSYRLIAQQTDEDAESDVEETGQKEVLRIEVTYDLIGSVQRKPTAAQATQFGVGESQLTVYPLFRSAVMQITGHAGFPTLVLPSSEAILARESDVEEED
ncbi:MAG: hypothetical protein ACOC2N_02505 [Spirochaetota bacterium]